MWIIIEKFTGEPYIMTDEFGNVLKFDRHDLAESYMKMECQDGMLVQL